MRRIAMLCAACLCTAGSARAQGQLLMNFDDCSAGPHSQAKVLDCASADAMTSIITSVIAPQDLSGVIADLGYVDVVVGSDPASMPEFWQFNAGGCGVDDFSVSGYFVLPAWPSCFDLWDGLASSGGQFGGLMGPTPDGNRARIKWTSTVVPADARTLPAGAEAYVSRIVLQQNHLRSCPSGCGEAACLIFDYETLWMLDGSTFAFGGDPAYCYVNDPTPTHPTSWGRVKQLYK